jgi:hypothetical protein
MKESGTMDILQQGLMFRCLNWGDEQCSSGVKEFAEKPRVKKPGRALAVRYFPIKEIPRLNSICNGCREGFFRIENRECLICGSSRVETVLDKDFASPPLLFVYKCRDCGRLLFSDAELKD